MTGEAPIWIDSHAHAFVLGDNLAADRRYTPPRSHPLEEYLSVLDAHNVSLAVLVQPSFLGTDNSYLLKVLAHYPARLRGVAVVDPECSPSQLDAFSKSGIAGLRLNVIEGMGPWRLDARLRRLSEGAAERGLHFELHARGDILAALVNFLLPTEVVVVVDHFGRPTAGWLEDPGFRAMLDVGRTGRVYAKLSAPYRVTGPNLADLSLTLRDALGADRLMWGSDWPCTQHENQHDYGQLMGMLNKWLPHSEDRAWAAGRTACALFGFRQEM